jgi:hypothetical protein
VYSARGLLAGAAGTVDFSFQAPEPDVLRLVVFGDSGVGSADQYAVARAIEADAVPPGLVMIVGDVNQPPASDAAYDSRFFAPYRTLLPAIPFYAAMGNHDYEVEKGKALLDVFTLPTNGPAGLVPETSYWLERAGVQMIVHDTNQTIGRLRDLSLPWHIETARRPADFRLVFQHHTMYSSGPNYERFPAGSLRALLGPLYTATGVDIVFNGHDHLYERTRPIGVVVYVTTGAGGPSSTSASTPTPSPSPSPTTATATRTWRCGGARSSCAKRTPRATGSTRFPSASRWWPRMRCASSRGRARPPGSGKRPDSTTRAGRRPSARTAPPPSARGAPSTWSGRARSGRRCSGSAVRGTSSSA